MTPLIMAATHGRVAIASKLLEAGASVDDVSEVSGFAHEYRTKPGVICISIHLPSISMIVSFVSFDLK